MILENRWATPLVPALRRGGAELVVAGYIAQDTLGRVSRRDREGKLLSTKEDRQMPGLLLTDAEFEAQKAKILNA